MTTASSKASDSKWVAWHGRPGGILPADPVVNIHRIDPYLVWAEATSFIEFLRPGEVAPQLVPVTIELTGGHIAADVSTPFSDLNKRFVIPGDSLFLTAKAGAAFFRWLVDDAGKIVRRVELSLPVVPERSDPQLTTVSVPALLGEVVLGLIDNGCPFAHRSLRRFGTVSTRIAALWDQTERPRDRQEARASDSIDPKLGDEPKDFGYGTEVTRKTLDELIRRHVVEGHVQEDACYSEAKYRPMAGRASHGAAVADLFAGPVPAANRVVAAGGRPPTWAPSSGVAATASVIFVQIPNDAAQDNSGRWLGSHVLDALRFIVHRAGSAKHVIINASYGPQTGPHDGTSILERAMNELIEKAGVRLDIVLPSGNSFMTRGHSIFDVASGETKCLRWRLLPSCEAASFAEIWLPSDCNTNDVDIALQPPGEMEADFTSADHVMIWPAAESPSAVIVYSSAVATGDNGTMVLLAVAPTLAFDPTRPKAPHGIWTIHLRNRSSNPLTKVHAYIARNDQSIGALKRGRQSFFEDPDYDPARYLREATDDRSAMPSYVHRRGTISGIATGDNRAVKSTTVVAGYRLHEGTHAPYSSAGPGRITAREPDCSAVSDQSAVLQGVLTGGNLSGTTVRLIGTSASAPQIARRIADGTFPPVVPSAVRDPSAPTPLPASDPDPDLDGDRGRQPF